MTGRCERGTGRWLRRAAVIALVALVAPAFAAPAGAAESSLYPLPTETRAGGLVAGPDGAMWFVGSHGPEYEGGEGNYIGRVAGNWEVSEFPLPKGAGAGAPIDGPEGDLWFPSYPAKGPGFGVTRMTTGGQMQEFRLSKSGGEVEAIAALGADELLVAATHFRHNKVKGHVLDRYAVTPTGLTLRQRLTRPPVCAVTAFAVGGDGFWYAEQCEPHRPVKPSWHSRIVHVVSGLEPARAYRLGPKSSVMSLAIDPEGGLWFGSFGDSGQRIEFGRIAPSGVLTTWPVPNGEPFSITLGPEGRLWFAIRDQQRVTRELQSIGPAGDLGTPICAGPDCEYTPYGLATGPEGQLWYSVEYAHIPYGGGGGGALMQENAIAKESGFLAHLTP